MINTHAFVGETSAQADAAFAWFGIAIGIFTVDAGLVIRTWDDWIASVTGIPALTGGPPGSPVIDMIPDTPCAIRSNPPLPRCGPV